MAKKVTFQSSFLVPDRVDGKEVTEEQIQQFMDSVFIGTKMSRDNPLKEHDYSAGKAVIISIKDEW